MIARRPDVRPGGGGSPAPLRPRRSAEELAGTVTIQYRPGKGSPVLEQPGGWSIEPDDLLAVAAIELTERYDTDRQDSPLGRVFGTTGQWIERFDVVIFVGQPAVLQRAQVLIDACADPWHNERDRADRGGRPRRYWCATSDDHDWFGSVIERLSRPGPGWPVGLALLSDQATVPADVEALARWLSESLRRSGQKAVPATVARFCDPVAVGPPTLFPAALAGLNVMRFLGGVHALTLAMSAPDSLSGTSQPSAVQRLAAIGPAARFQTPHRSLRTACHWLNRQRAAAPKPGGGTRDRSPEEIQEIQLCVTKHRHSEIPPGGGGLPLAAGSMNDSAARLILPIVSEHTIGQLFQLGLCLHRRP